jgi:hypothetical protein
VAAIFTPARAALPGLDVPRLPRAPRRRAAAIARSAGAAQAGRHAGGLRGRVRALDPRLSAPHAVRAPRCSADVALGRRHGACFVLAPGDAAGADRRAAFDGAPLHALRRRGRLLALAFAARGALAWGMEVAGRRAAASVLSELRLGARRAAAARRSRPRSTARGPARSRPPPCRASTALEAYFARYLPQVVLASSSRSRARPGWRRSTSSRRS